MKLSVYILIHVLYLKNAQCGIVTNLLDTLSGEIHNVAEGIHNIVSVTNKHNNGENCGEADETESVIDSEAKYPKREDSFSENDFFYTKEQRHSSVKANNYLRKDKASGRAVTPKDTLFKDYNKGSEHINENYDGAYTGYNSVTNNIEDLEKNKHGNKLSSNQYTPEYNNEDRKNIANTDKLSDFHQNALNGDRVVFNKNNKTDFAVSGGNDITQMPGYTDNGKKENISRIDEIVFPGQISNGKPNTSCPEGLVIAADGACLKPKIIYMGNKTQNRI